MIPMRGMVQSLNLSVTAALCLYELTRQRTARGLDGYLYSDKEQQELVKEFLMRGS
jgi:tRNA C32,U32 (ribose-2'-O)-methylase TrmJ